jgi:dienelactone hydrolase
LQTSIDGGATWNEMKTPAGTPYSIGFTAAGATYLAIDPRALRRAQALKIRSGTALVPVNQTNLVSLTLVTRPTRRYADPSKTRARAIGGLSALSARPEVDASRIGAIGFCFGGSKSLELARSGADIRAVVGFHSALATVAPKTDAKAPPWNSALLSRLKCAMRM